MNKDSLIISDKEKKQLSGLLTRAYRAAKIYDDSIEAQSRLFKPLALLDGLLRNKGADLGKDPASIERNLLQTARPDDGPADMPETVNDFLTMAGFFDNRLRSAGKEDKTLKYLEGRGAHIDPDGGTFIQPKKHGSRGGRGNKSSGNNKPTSSESSAKHHKKTQARLDILTDNLCTHGVNVDGENQSINISDLNLIPGKVGKDTSRTTPYTIVQIAKLNMEVAVCNEVGYATFVKKGLGGKEFWENNDTDALYAREDVWDVRFANEESWWNKIAKHLSGNSPPDKKTKATKKYLLQDVPIDKKKAMDTLLEHYRATGKALSPREKEGKDGKPGSYIIRHGEYKGIRAGTFDARLRKIGTSIAKLNEELAEIHANFNYKNKGNVDTVDKQKAMDTLLAHYRATKKPLLANDKEGGNTTPGSYIIKHGEYTGITARALDWRLSSTLGLRISDLNEELAKIHDYFNHKTPLDLAPLNRKVIRNTLTFNYMETGKFLPSGHVGDNITIQHGIYKGATARQLDSRLRTHMESSIAQEYDLIAQDVGVDGGSRAQDKQALGEALILLKEDTVREFEGDEEMAIEYLGELSYDQMVSELKGLVKINVNDHAEPSESSEPLVS